MGRKAEVSRAARVARGAVDTALAVALVYMMFLICASLVDVANRRTELRLLLAEAEALYDAFDAYSERNHGFPGKYSGSGFDRETLDPLRKRGYYRGSLTSFLHSRRVDGYDSPDDTGPNREFWVELTLRSDPTIRVLVARSDDAPLGGGSWHDGVFLFRDGQVDSQVR